MHKFLNTLKRRWLDSIYSLCCLAGIISFWLPWIKTGFLGDFNGYQVFKMLGNSNMTLANIVLMIPLTFLLLCLLRWLKPSFVNGFKLKIAEILLFLMVLSPNMYLIGRTLSRPGVEVRLEHFYEFFGHGLVIALLSSMAVAFSPRISKPRLSE